MTGRAAGDGLLERLLDAAPDGAEAYERRGAHLLVSEDDDGRRVEESSERGFALRLFHAGRVSFAAGTPESALRLPGRATELLARSRARRGARPASPLAGETPGSAPMAPVPIPDEAPLYALLAAFRRAVAEAGRGTVTVREISAALGRRRERLLTSAGRNASWECGATSLSAVVVGRAAGGRFSARIHALASSPEGIPVARLARHAADRVLLPLSGRPSPGGPADLLLDPLVAAHLVGRLAPLFLGDGEEALLEARTRGGRDPLASAALTLVDAPGVPAGPIDTPRDGEGTPQGRTIVLDEGRPAARLTDVAAATRLGRTPTGNAIRPSWTEPPEIGVTNFFVDTRGGISPVDLLGGVARGFYAAVLLERPEVDLAADRFRLVAAGWGIEQGRATARHSPVVIEGRLSEFLRSVSATGDDLKFVATPAGAAGAPTLLVPRWKMP